MHQQGREVAEGCCKGLGSAALGLFLNKASPVILAQAAGSAQKPGKLNDIIWALPTDSVSTQTLSARVSAEEWGWGALLVLDNPLKLPFLLAKVLGRPLIPILVSTVPQDILTQPLWSPSGDPVPQQHRSSKPASVQCRVARTSPGTVPSVPFPPCHNAALATATGAACPVAEGWSQLQEAAGLGLRFQKGGHSGNLGTHRSGTPNQYPHEPGLLPLRGGYLISERSDTVERKVSSGTKHRHPSGISQGRTHKGTRITLLVGVHLLHLEV